MYSSGKLPTKLTHVFFDHARSHAARVIKHHLTHMHMRRSVAVFTQRGSYASVHVMVPWACTSKVRPVDRVLDAWIAPHLHVLLFQKFREGDFGTAMQINLTVASHLGCVPSHGRHWPERNMI